MLLILLAIHVLFFKRTHGIRMGFLKMGVLQSGIFLLLNTAALLLLFFRKSSGQESAAKKASGLSIF